MELVKPVELVELVYRGRTSGTGETSGTGGACGTGGSGGTGGTGGTGEISISHTDRDTLWNRRN